MCRLYIDRNVWLRLNFNSSSSFSIEFSQIYTNGYKKSLFLYWHHKIKSTQNGNNSTFFNNDLKAQLRLYIIITKICTLCSYFCSVRSNLLDTWVLVKLHNCSVNLNNVLSSVLKPAHEVLLVCNLVYERGNANVEDYEPSHKKRRGYLMEIFCFIMIDLLLHHAQQQRRYSLATLRIWRSIVLCNHKSDRRDAFLCHHDLQFDC